MKLYVASSWRNPLQPTIVHALRRSGHEVYDFRNPKEGDTGFGWQQVMSSKAGYVVMFNDDEPDLMFSEAKILTSMNDLFDAFGEPLESAAS
jgi:hypothetical protein